MTAESDPEKMFSSFGCAACHGPNAVFADKLLDAKNHDVEWLATWIKDAPSLKAGVQMPTFKGVMDDERAHALARWVKAYAAKQGG